MTKREINERAKQKMIADDKRTSWHGGDNGAGKALPMRSVMIIELHANNDRNGNPRRLSLVINGDDGLWGRWQAGTVIAALDHGYSGASAVENKFIELVMRPWYDVTVVKGPSINVTPAEYKATLKQHGRTPTMLHDNKPPTFTKKGA